jgi:iron complex transport system substrate-binding protein
MMRIKNKTRLCVLLVLSALCCRAAQARTVTDMAGRRVNIPDRVDRVVADRFVSLIAFALDAKMLCNAAFRVSDAGKKYISEEYYTGKPLMETDAEEVLKLRPDVILTANLGGTTRENADVMQRRLKIPVLVVDFEMKRYRNAFAFLGEALNRAEAAGRITAYIDRYLAPLNRLTAAVPQEKRPSVYYAEGLLGLNTEPSGSIHSQVIDFLNAKNVARTRLGDVHGMSEVSMEQLLIWNPDAVVVWSGFPSGMGLPGNDGQKKKTTFEHIVSDPVWAKVAAVKNGRVYQVPALPFGWLDRPPSSNCLPGTLWLAKILYPDLFDFDTTEALREYFLLFYHVKVTEDELESIMSGTGNRK